MRRLATAAVLPCSVALFIVLAPIAAADETSPSTTTAPTTTTEPGDTTTAPPTTTVPQPRGPKLIQPGVTIGGLLVGGLTKAEARELVEQRFGKPDHARRVAEQEDARHARGARRGRVRRQGGHDRGAGAQRRLQGPAHDRRRKRQAEAVPRRPREADRPGAGRREPHAAQLRPRRASVGAGPAADAVRRRRGRSPLRFASTSARSSCRSGSSTRRSPRPTSAR